MQQGIFTISLDFELHWGVSEKKTVESYKVNLDGTRAAIDGMLKLFREYQIHVTWAAVGMLFCKNKAELLGRCSTIQQPDYHNPKLSNFKLAQHVGNDVLDDPYHFATDIIPKILQVPHQELGSHTFSHYYCMEKGQSLDNFRSDLLAALEVAKANNFNVTSIVFPRNLFLEKHIQASYEAGFTNYRGTENHWMYQPVTREIKIMKAFRLLDTYVKISGNNTHELPFHSGEKLYNVPASRFFRPYNPKFRMLERRRLNRIKKEMTYAARKRRLFHLWWHPHNFGANTQINLKNLEEVLEHYAVLKNKYQFSSLSMGEICEYFKNR